MVITVAIKMTVVDREHNLTIAFYSAEKKFRLEESQVHFQSTLT
jgi:hypothetical protein